MNHIDQLKNTTFKSSTQTTAQFASFAKAYKRAIVNALGELFELLAWDKRHFYISALIKNTRAQKLVYIACSDVRFFPGEWHARILIRQAKSDKHYTGGANHHTTSNTLLKRQKD